MSGTAIVAVDASVTGFVGTSSAPVPEDVVSVSSFAEFEQAFGGLVPELELGYAVHQFFASGGREARVVAVPTDVPLDDGLRRLDAAGSVGLLCLPGEADTTVLAAALEFAERRRALLLVDAPGSSLDDARVVVSALRGPKAANAAAFLPAIRVPDPLASGELRTCPSSGAVAGMYARNDGTRGIWSAPAGAHASLTGVVEPAVDLGEHEVAELAEAGVNGIRRLRDAGVVVWGARTLAEAEPASEWKYVNVRRLALFLEESIDRGIGWAVFEPNDEQLWRRLRADCTGFLQGLFDAGAFAGRTADDSYFVRCGPDTMTQDDIDGGRLIVVVGIAPLRPAEFVVLRIEQILARTPGGP